MEDQQSNVPANIQEIKTEDWSDDPVIKAMADAGAFYGRKKSKTHPRMREYIFTTRNDIEIVDLVRTKELLERAKEFVYSVAAKKGLFLFVGVQPSARSTIQEIAGAHSFPFVTNRWLGGTLTNFKVISKRIEYLKKLRSDLSTGALQKYTKKERLQFNKELEKLEHLLGGLENLTRLPDAVIVAGIEEHTTAIRESRGSKIPVVSIVGTASDPDEVSYPIPANDSAKSSIAYFLGQLAEAIQKGTAESKEGNQEKKEA